MIRKPLIGIDASRSNIAQKTGTEYYSYELIKNLVKIPEARYRLYSKTPIDYIATSNDIENKVIRFPRLWSQFGLSIEIMRAHPNVLFVPAHTIPIYHGKKSVITVHDLGFKHFPELYTPLERYYHDFSASFSVGHATKIIAISEATKKDIIKTYKVNEDKITVIYHGYDKEKYNPLKKGDSPPSYLKEFLPYFYYIGRLEAKKNIVNLVKAYEEVRSNTSIKHKLVLAGRPGYQYDEIKREIEKLPGNLRNDVIELGYVEDKKVNQFMRWSDVFAFPSKFEGFGMPLVEAMASGIPIVGSNTTSIPEIVSNCGLLSDPDDYKSLAKNMTELVTNSKLRSELHTYGLARANMFDWEKCARETLGVILSTL
jgi:glycosyltransferase involved in cell wall biosynthesis